MIKHAALMLLALVACKNATEPFVENVDISVCSPTAGPFTLTIDNPFFPLTPGTQWVLLGKDGPDSVRLAVTVLPDTVTIAGVKTRVLEERESHNNVLVEISRNFFVQTAGTVCYYGEDVDIYTNGSITSHEGQWRAGVAGASPGIFVPASPTVGMAFRQEIAPGIAEDRVTIVAAGESVTVPLGTYTNTLRFAETTPLEDGTSTKVYASAVGMIVDDVVRLTTKTP